MKTKIAIDPDVKKNGVAIFHEGKINSCTLPFFELISKIEDFADPELFIEAGWLNHKKNFRYFGSIRNISNEVSARVGANHQIGKLLEEFAISKKLNYHLIKPLRKCWKGADGKITQQELNMILRAKGLEELKRSNQDQRDAILILLNVL